MSGLVKGCFLTINYFLLHTDKVGKKLWIETYVEQKLNFFFLIKKKKTKQNSHLSSFPSFENENRMFQSVNLFSVQYFLFISNIIYILSELFHQLAYFPDTRGYFYIFYKFLIFFSVAKYPNQVILNFDTCYSRVWNIEKRL